MRKLIIGRTYFPSGREEGLPNKIARLKACLAFMSEEVRQTAALDGGILVAPEHYFNARTEQGVVGPGLNESAKRDIERELTLLSKQHPTILLMAGSMVWVRFQSQKSKEYEAYAESKRARGMAPLPKEEWALKRDTAPARLEKFIEMAKDVPYAHQGSPQPLEGAFKTFTKERRDGIVKNSAYGYLNGERALKYNKIAGVDETIGYESSAVFFPGMFKAKTEWSPGYTLGGVSMGVEICADHASGIGAQSPWFGNVDLHVIVSDTVTNEPAHFGCKEGGYVIHASIGMHDGVYFRKKSLTREFEEVGATETWLERGLNYRLLRWCIIGNE